VIITFGLFTNGLSAIDQAFDEGIIDRILSTNLIYQSPELKARPWYISCDMSKYLAYIIDTLNHDRSISDLLDPYNKTWKFIERYNKARDEGVRFQ
jgi:ribose-phosphate pyrophosphokinase